jgi:hypothetical protein
MAFGRHYSTGRGRAMQKPRYLSGDGKKKARMRASENESTAKRSGVFAQLVTPLADSATMVRAQRLTALHPLTS